MMAQRIWFITGISSGLGKALADEVIARGDYVIGSFRNKDQAESFDRQFQGRASACIMDVRDHAGIERCVREIEGKFGRIDVLVNNAGYGILGAVEEVSIPEARAIMETNFFGPLKIIQEILPMMRSRKQGYMVQVSSASGIKATPGFGLYNASKFALEGLSEALAAELMPLGIRLMIVEPGPFRTEFAGHSILSSPTPIPDYDSTAGNFKRIMAARHGKQEGDPSKAAKAIFECLFSEHPPLRLVLGKSAIDNVKSKIELMQRDLKDWESVGLATSFTT